MISKEEIKILNVFKKDLFSEFSVKDIMRKTDKKSYSWIFNSVKKLSDLDLIDYSEKAGIKVYFVNLSNPLVYRYFSILDYEKSSLLPLKNIFSLIDFSPVKYFSLIVGGSYSEMKNVKNSDLDVLVIVENKVDVGKVSNVLVNKSLTMKPKVDLNVFSRKDFLEMLLSNEENLGKQFYEKGIVLFGSESYYKILKEAHENGFRG